ncbi:hypothetical protein CW304_31085 [Bacillus sp. UFRGS-B20]|nr:hypothetical protein CW304_31085 [Bacillus sp. UFRGS-B20]
MQRRIFFRQIGFFLNYENNNKLNSGESITSIFYQHSGGGNFFVSVILFVTSFREKKKKKEKKKRKKNRTRKYGALFDGGYQKQKRLFKKKTVGRRGKGKEEICLLWKRTLMEYVLINLGKANFSKSEKRKLLLLGVFIV